MSFKVFKDGASEPVIECATYGSKDLGGRLFLEVDGADIEVTEKLIICNAEPDTFGTYTVVDVLVPNDVLLAARQTQDEKVAAAEKLAEEARVKALAAAAEAVAAQGLLDAVNGAVQKREPSE